MLVLGGIRSGKSQWAESTIGQDAAVRYVATGMEIATDASWQQRIAAHRDRRPGHWSTVETVDVANHLRAHPGESTLVDDMGNWLTAALDRRGWTEESIESDVAELVSAVTEFTGSLILVSPEAGLTVVPANESGRRFIDELGILNQRLARCCDRVMLVVAGLPVQVKPPAGASS